jgi:thiamine biosynthesis lipoprotein
MSPAAARVRVLVPLQISPQRPAAAARIQLLQGRSMGCAWSVRYVLDSAVTDPATLESGIQAVLDRVVALLSNWEPDSCISRFNQAAGGSWHALPEEFATVLACALRVAEASGGACDPTAGELVRRWGFGATNRYSAAGFVPPDAIAIATALRRCGWQRLEVDAADMRMYQPGGLELDLSAVAKGYGVDAVSCYLGAQGLHHYLVEVGGELRGAGVKPDGQPWWVALQLPTDATGLPVSRLALHDLSVATSGDYLQCYEHAGTRYSHCIDPRTGSPVRNGVASVTVLHQECMAADAWSTALMVLGADAGLALAEARGLAVYFVTREAGHCVEHYSSAFDALIH